MDEVFPIPRAAKRQQRIACTTRTFAVTADDISRVWDEASARVITELDLDVLQDAEAIAVAERSRVVFAEGLTAERSPISLSCAGGSLAVGALVECWSQFVVLEGADRTTTAVRLAAVMRSTGVVHRLPGGPAGNHSGDRTWASWLRAVCEPASTQVQIRCTDGWGGVVGICYVGLDFMSVLCSDGTTCDVMLESIASVTVATSRLTA